MLELDASKALSWHIERSVDYLVCMALLGWYDYIGLPEHIRNV